MLDTNCSPHSRHQSHNVNYRAAKASRFHRGRPRDRTLSGEIDNRRPRIRVSPSDLQSLMAEQFVSRLDIPIPRRRFP